MPNWCNNKLTISGSINDVAKFVKKANGPLQHYKPSSWEIEADKKFQAKAEAEGLPFKSTLPKVIMSPLSFHQLVPIPDHIMENGYDEVEQRNSKNTGYDWEHKLWGVKWGASDAILEHSGDTRADYTFTTPWGPPKVFLETVSKDFPELTFLLSFEEEYPSRGKFVVFNGQVDYHANDYGSGEDYPEYSNDLSEDEDEEEERHILLEEWRLRYYEDHDNWVEETLESLK